MRLLIIVGFTVTLCKASQQERRRFPEDFLFGTSTAFYGTEDERDTEVTIEIWENANHGKLDVIRDKRNGDIERNGHTNYKQDVKMMMELGLNACRLSISWSRLLPNGLSNKASHDGVAYYNNYINEMIKYNITPIVTLYNNWGLPQNLKDRGGFINPLYAEWFEDYARFAYKNFGDRVKYWITFNDPKETCYNGYGYDTTSVANVTDVKTYYCAKNLVMAHAKAYHAYVKDFKQSQGGFCGIMINVDWFEPLSETKEDRFAAEIKRQAEWGIFAEPIFSKYGGFPKELFAIVPKKSAAQGYYRLRMPEFTKDERDFVRGSSDFFGVNHHTSHFVSAEEQKRHYTVPSLQTDVDLQTISPHNSQKSDSSKFRIVQNSLFNVVTHLQKKYNNPIMYIAENGWPKEENDEIDDDIRIKYYEAALNSVLDALEVGVDLRGYIAWSLLDNFERTERYLERLGLNKVHFDCQLHIPRKSAFIYKQIIKTRTVDSNYKPNNFTIWIEESLEECLSREIHKNPEVYRNLCQHHKSQGSTGIILSDNLRSILTAVCGDEKRQKRRFSDDFLFGVSTASYQIEGGWNADDKSENIWDHLTHTKPDFIRDRSNGDFAADTYNNYKRDVEMLRELGVDVYRFSLSWTRILPNGLSNKVSRAGIEFYNNYINEMLKYNIKPIVTLYHFDMPQKLQDFGGLMNPLFAEWFEDYASVAFKHFGDRVKHWITFNEPKEICENGYGSSTLAPALNATDVGTYYCAKNLAIAHAKAYYAYINDFKPSQGGVCGIILSFNWLEPLTDSEEDRFAAEMLRQAQWNIFVDPIFSEHGGFPKELSEIIANKSLAEGYVKSRMPEFTDEERELVRGSSDFFGVNHYTAHLVSANKYKMDHPEFRNEVDAGIYAPPEWPRSTLFWLTFAPKSLFKTVTYIQKKYNSPIMYITENGWAQPADEGIEDKSRVTYMRAALNDVLDALEVGVDIRGYMVWSLMDNFEWEEGYTQRFGLYEVNFNSQRKIRSPRKSAFVYKDIIKTRVIDQGYDPKNLTMWIDEDH